MSAEDAKKGKMTVFKTDRHEDWAAMVFVAILTIGTLLYMGFIVPDLKLTPPADGKLVSVAVKEGTKVKKGDLLYTLEIKKKKYIQKTIQEKSVVEEIKSKADGLVLKVHGVPGSEVKKGKNTIVVLEHVKGTLP
jgi:acetyl/propionyl-CoA carboxylase alpha subunit